MDSTITLHRLFPEIWGADQPSRLVDLVNADYESLDDTARALRALAVQLVHSFERAPVLTAKAAQKLLEDHHLPVRVGKWVTVALNAERERIYAKGKGGAMRQVHAVTNEFPTKDVLDKRAPIPEGGTYLVIYGGSPEILQDSDACHAKRTLTSEAPVADVLLWDVDDEGATCWSIAAGGGARGSVPTEFPDTDALEKWRQA